MPEEIKYTEEDCHLKFAKDCFNYVWTLLEKEDRTSEEDDEMVHAAHASRYHWGKVGVPVNFARGEWQISRVYSELGSPEPAMYHAQRCLAICVENDLGSFDLAYAYEAIARAAAVAGHKDDCRHHLDLARTMGETIEKADFKELLMDDLKTIIV